MKLKDVKYTNMLEKNYEKALSLKNRYSFINTNILPLLNKEEKDMFLGFQDLKNRYSFINTNILPLLNKEEKDMFLGFQDVCMKLQKEVNIEDVYDMLPKLGEHYMLQRMNTYDGVKGSCKNQMLLSLAVNGMAPEVDFAATASAILVGNSLYHNPNRTEVQEKALKEIYRGTKVGGIGITEIEHGSDAVNMKMKATMQDDGSVTYNGIKVYTTNGAVADYFSTYGVTDISNPRRTMMLTMFERGDLGLKAERLHIPAGRGVGI
ncbi:MAG: acyl-CoA dehydrogenase family protein, partial [Promethearchaeota archaeon]